MKYNPSFSHHILNKSSKDRLNAVMVLYNAINKGVYLNGESVSYFKNSYRMCYWCIPVFRVSHHNFLEVAF